MKRQISTFRIIPSGLLQAILDTASTPRQAESLKKLCTYIFGKYCQERIPFSEPIEISQNHFREQFNVHYWSALKTLKDAEILHTDDSYHYFKDGKRKGKCKAYLFDPNLIYTEPEIISVDLVNKKRFDSDYVTQETVKLLSKLRLSVDRRKMKDFIKRFVSPSFILERCKIDNDIPGGLYRIKGSNIPRELSELQKIADTIGYNLILYKDIIHIEPKRLFLQRKLFETRSAYLDRLLRIKDIRKRSNINCGRNATNGRLDTNLTNLKDGLINLVTLDGERLMNIDLKNSQFTLFSILIDNIKTFHNIYRKDSTQKLSFSSIDKNITSDSSINSLYTGRNNKYYLNVTQLLEKIGRKLAITDSLPTDLLHFEKLTKSGGFYEYFAEILSDELGRKMNRKDAKKVMFLTAFSSYRYNPEPKRILKKHFPTVVAIMNDFKRWAISEYQNLEKTSPERFKQLTAHRRKHTPQQLGNAELAVYLQTVESYIFIDRILTRLLQSGYRVFSKHDSILCKVSDFQDVYSIVKDELSELIGIGNYRLDTE